MSKQKQNDMNRLEFRNRLSTESAVTLQALCVPRISASAVAAAWGNKFRTVPKRAECRQCRPYFAESVNGGLPVSSMG